MRETSSSKGSPFSHLTSLLVLTLRHIGCRVNAIWHIQPPRPKEPKQTASNRTTLSTSAQTASTIPVMLETRFELQY